jgi:hypothetical protein
VFCQRAHHRSEPLWHEPCSRTYEIIRPTTSQQPGCTFSTFIGHESIQTLESRYKWLRPEVMGIFSLQFSMQTLQELSFVRTGLVLSRLIRPYQHSDRWHVFEYGCGHSAVLGTIPYGRYYKIAKVYRAPSWQKYKKMSFNDIQNIHNSSVSRQN